MSGAKETLESDKRISPKSIGLDEAGCQLPVSGRKNRLQSILRPIQAHEQVHGVVRVRATSSLRSPYESFCIYRVSEPCAFFKRATFESRNSFRMNA